MQNDSATLDCPVNLRPVITSAPRVPIDTVDFNIVHRERCRPRTAILARQLESRDETIWLVDSSSYVSGDVFQLLTGERIQFIVDPDRDGKNAIPIIRAVEGTKISRCEEGDMIRLVSNHRTGAQFDQSGVAYDVFSISQHCQTWKCPVVIPGPQQSSFSFMTGGENRTPFEQIKAEALENLMDCMEASTYYGTGHSSDSAWGGNPGQKGIRALIDSRNVSNRPRNADNYEPADLIRDTISKARGSGGDPDVLLISSNFAKIFTYWGIDDCHPDLAGIRVIEAPLLLSFTAFAITSHDICMRMKQDEFWNPAGSTENVYKGEWVAEGAVELKNPSHHAWVENVRSFGRNSAK